MILFHFQEAVKLGKSFLTQLGLEPRPPDYCQRAIPLCYNLFQISGKKCCGPRSKVVKLSICTPKDKGSILEVEIRNIIIQDFIIQTTKNLDYDISDFDFRDRTLAIRSAK